MKLYRKIKSPETVYELLHGCRVYFNGKVSNGVFLRTTGLKTPIIYFALEASVFKKEFEVVRQH